MKVSQLLTEGAFVVKSKDGVEKRFKNPDSPEAKAWKASLQQKPVKIPKNDGYQAELEENAVKLVWTAIHKMDEWGALDWIDLFKSSALPHIAKSVKNYPNDYSDKFKAVVDEMKRHDVYDKITPYLNKAVKSAKAAGSWNGYVRQMSSYAKGKN